jgi:hypothetical protein
MQRTLQTTTHAVVRQAQRNLSAQDIEFVITYGQCLYSGGALHVFLRNRDIPRDKAGYRQFARREGTTLVIKEEGDIAVLITTYRNRHGLKAIRLKDKHDRRSAIVKCVFGR